MLNVLAFGGLFDDPDTAFTSGEMELILMFHQMQ